MGGGLFIWLGDDGALPVVAMLIVTAMVLPVMAILFIEEAAPVRRAIGPQLAGLARDLGEVLRARSTSLGLIFFLSPVGTAISGLISGVTPPRNLACLSRWRIIPANAETDSGSGKAGLRGPHQSWLAGNGTRAARRGCPRCTKRASVFD
jgi:hypothetical protein